MINDKKECVDFWLYAKKKIAKFKKIDDIKLIFGVETRNFGHKYQILPTVTDKEILAFEANNGFELPLEYLTFLQTFGAGGAGPYYGIYDFRKRVLPRIFLKPFPYTTTFTFSDDVTDDEPIWDYDGLAFIGEAGCGADFYIELNGSNPGQIWCSWQEECSIQGSFLDFYNTWLEKTDLQLNRYQRLKELKNRRNLFCLPAKLKFDDVISHMQCSYNEKSFRDEKYITEGQIWIRFEHTHGKVILNEKRDVIKIDFSY